MKNQKRIDELTEKFFLMGNALLIEGDEKDDINIQKIGNFFILLAGITTSEDDINKFSELCAMFSAKKIVEEATKNGDILNVMENIKKMLGKNGKTE